MTYQQVMSLDSQLHLGHSTGRHSVHPKLAANGGHTLNTGRRRRIKQTSCRILAYHRFPGATTGPRDVW